MVNEETKIQELDGVSFAFVELPKFKKRLNELNSIIDKWVYFIKNAKNLDLIPKEFEDKKEFQEAFKIANQYNWSKEEIEVYDYINLKEMDEANAIKTAEKKGAKAKQIEIAKNLLDVLDIETIALKTGLDIEEIKKLR